jgi:hypothetical protein
MCLLFFRTCIPFALQPKQSCWARMQRGKQNKEIILHCQEMMLLPIVTGTHQQHGNRHGLRCVG